MSPDEPRNIVWHLDEPADSVTVADFSGHGRAGAVAGATLGHDGRFGKCAQFTDGSGSQIEVADDAGLEFGEGDFTIEAWIKPWYATGSDTVVSKWSGTEKSWRLSIQNGVPTLDLWPDGATVAVSVSGGSVPANKWTHVAAVREGDEVRLYVNADETPVATGSVTGLLADTSGMILIGAADVAGGEEYFDGFIDEVRLSSAAKHESLNSVVVDYAYNARNQLVTETSGTTTKTYSYDRNGNTVGWIEEVQIGTDPDVFEEVASATMTYDELNRMLSYTGPEGTESFTYRGAEWHRFSQTYSGVTTGFFCDGDNVAADIVGGVVDRTYVTPFLDQNLSMSSGTDLYYYSQDGLGSVRTLSDPNGAVMNQYDYTAFGVPVQLASSDQILQRYRYTSREANPASPLAYYRYRQYQPEAGRFTTRDPVWPSSQAGIYGYVGSRVVSGRDPFGLLTDFGGGLPRSVSLIYSRSRIPVESFTEVTPPGAVSTLSVGVTPATQKGFEDQVNRFKLLPLVNLKVRRMTTNSILNRAFRVCNKVVWVGHGGYPGHNLASMQHLLGTAPEAPPARADWSIAIPSAWGGVVEEMHFFSCYGESISIAVETVTGIEGTGAPGTFRRKQVRNLLVQQATTFLAGLEARLKGAACRTTLCILVGPGTP